ncbi:MAG: BamA/TamA family outer membrane protein [Giesbergeria sp.]|jgi:translocation and assembly module TamA|nr:BamA/TamA family outer membrane protein [Giesbergeria sp.]MBP6160016.1 BamA/TamA family outer membrane protein [Giesbergeria sp.]MBP7084495.1 BamA/TamA family outer membrane protein [Giesbergeria sp.]MBP9784316.1 BamA/TamA family outer membrane protein [Giesbergeria sp.]MBP9894641.1 BamA/TamA family outer membrane protein [Giesbergeria sp.]
MPHSRAVRAGQLALLLFFAISGALTGCSALTPTASERSSEAAASGAAAFTLQVRAPKEVRDYLEKHLELQRFRAFPDLQERELSRLLGAADANARELLATLGYFSPDIQIDLTKTPDDRRAPRAIVVTVDPGERTTIKALDLRFQGDIETGPTTSRPEARARAAWSLNPGEPFTQEAWDDAKKNSLRALQKRRYPTASLANSRADIDADTHQAALSATFDSGPAYRFGPLHLKGMKRYDAEGIKNIARLPTGAVYDETELLDAQQRLASSGYFDAVFLTLDPDAQQPGAAPVTAQVREAPLQKAIFGIGVSTDSGMRLSLDHTYNQLPWLGWRALTKLSFDREAKVLGTEWTALPGANGWRWVAGAQLQREATGDYQVNSTQWRFGRSQSTDHIDRNYALQYDSAVSQGPMAPPESTALSLNTGWTGRYFDSKTAPASGWGLAAEFGVGTTLRPERDPFVRALARGLYFQPLAKVTAPDGSSRRARIALRTEVGAVLARPGAQIPVTQLFLTGGDTTVRGYSLRSIGARTESDQLFGGRYLAVASAEWQRPLVFGGTVSDFESALFVDVGAVADRLADLHARVGVGAGLRWRSPVGPLQTDLAYGVQAKQLRLHLRLGFTF